MKTSVFSLVLRTRENTDVFITLDDNIYGIHSKRVNILYTLILTTFKVGGCIGTDKHIIAFLGQHDKI